MADFNITLDSLNGPAAAAGAVSEAQKGKMTGLKTSWSIDPNPKSSLTTYTLSEALQGFATYKPSGATYDLFNQDLSRELEGLRGEKNPGFEFLEDRRLSPYDIFEGEPSKNGLGLSTGAAVAAQVNNAQPAGSPAPASTETLPPPVTNIKIYSRQEWGATTPLASTVPLPYNEVIIHTAAGAASKETDSVETDFNLMRQIERLHVNGRGWAAGVGYNFVISGAGRIFEGRGWGRQGTHTQNRNSQMGVCFLGHGDQQPATTGQWASAKGLIIEALKSQRLQSGYEVSGHREYASKSCPGNLIYPLIEGLAGLSG